MTVALSRTVTGTTGAAGTVGAAIAVPDALCALPIGEAGEQWVEAFEREYVRRGLEHTGGNVTAFAERAGLNRTYTQRIVGAMGSPRRDPTTARAVHFAQRVFRRPAVRERPLARVPPRGLRPPRRIAACPARACTS